MPIPTFDTFMQKRRQIPLINESEGHMSTYLPVSPQGFHPDETHTVIDTSVIRGSTGGR